MLLRTLLPFKRRYQERDASSGDEVPEVGCLRHETRCADVL
ncbi:hypothetical protein TGFOU_406210 [Toxoplasma gondii FOU]|uniref:Uncharacterized protein n=1 Tax=Toxoplasma gondii FOU TaxID=943167 RepID=A0A086JR22_TOXGO|nr:hypothetical protein TGFOU_406210 [Toxoplasma gondii FOU]